MTPLDNPEFRRNLWTEFSAHRLIAMPVLLGLVFLGTEAGLGKDQINDVAQLLLFGLLVIWGGRQAAGAVVDEVVGGTWDSQRMSAISPWSMTWGKLLGATAYSWYGAAFCLLALLWAGRSNPGDILTMLLTALTAQGVALFLGLLLQRGQRPTALLGTVTLAQAAAIVMAAFMATRDDLWSLETTVLWWDWALPVQAFLLGTELAALVWVVAGIHALMRGEMRYRPQPWTWLLFLGFCTIYAAGFTDPMLTSQAFGSMIAVGVAPLATAYAVALLLTLAAAVLSANDSMTLRRWLAAPTSTRKRPTALALEAPAWVIGLTVTVLLAVAVHGAWSAVPLPSWLPVFLWSSVLFLIRDLGVVLAMTLDGDRRRGTLGAVLYLGTLYLLVPLALGELVPGIDMALRPTEGATVSGSLVPALAQALAAGGLVVWRWQRAGLGLSAKTAS